MNFIKDHIISSYDLSDSKLENVLSAACPFNIDFADLYFQYTNSESWQLEEVQFSHLSLY